MTYALVAVALAVVVIWYLAARRRPENDKAAMPAAGMREKPFRCVSIRPGSFRCEAARQIEGKRFLLNEAPKFPLPGCSARRCECGYRQHADRRVADRRNPYDLRAANWSDKEGERRAARRGRRREDMESGG